MRTFELKFSLKDQYSYRGHPCIGYGRRIVPEICVDGVRHFRHKGPMPKKIKVKVSSKSFPQSKGIWIEKFSDSCYWGVQESRIYRSFYRDTEGVLLKKLKNETKSIFKLWIKISYA